MASDRKQQPKQQPSRHPLESGAMAMMTRTLATAGLVADGLNDKADAAADEAADEAYLAAVLGHRPRGWWRVVTRDERGRPRVLATYPLWCEGGDGGRGGDGKETWRPFPNLFWLTDADLIVRISELERVGTIALLEAAMAEDVDFRAKVDRDHARYAAMRWAMLDEQARELARSLGFDEALQKRGVGGLTPGGLKIKCLHAHVAHHLAGGAGNEVGRRVMEMLGEG